MVKGELTGSFAELNLLHTIWFSFKLWEPARAITSVVDIDTWPGLALVGYGPTADPCLASTYLPCKAPANDRR